MTALLTMMFKGRSSSALVQFCRYVLMGGFSFLVDFATLMVLYRYCGLHYLVAATIATLVGLATIYTSSIVWVFEKRTVDNRVAEFLIFAGLGAVGMGITVVAMYLLVDHLGTSVPAGKVVAAALAFGWNFTSRKLLLFTAFTPRPA